MVEAASSFPGELCVRERMNWEFDPQCSSVNAIQSAFRSFGFALIRNVLDQQELSTVRAELDRAFDSGPLKNLPVMCPTELLMREAVWRCLFKEHVVSSLRAALGPELCYQNDMDVQRNSYGQAALQPHKGWHMDAGSETHHDYLRSADYRFAKCGIFLQDFDTGWGGGIMVKPKSHRRFFEPNPLKRSLFSLRRALDRGAIRAGLNVDTLEVPTRAGDLCFFDSRLLHSSVLPNAANIRKIGYHGKRDIGLFWPEIPKAYTKYVIYWDACNTAMTEDFLRNSIGRAEIEIRSGQHGSYRPAVFTGFLSLRYPDDYPSDFVAAARSRGVAVASLDTERATFYKQQLRSMPALRA
jgi:hypothetical protein